MVRLSMLFQDNMINKIVLILVCIAILLSLAISTFSAVGADITDQEKQQAILTMVNNHRNIIPSELVLSIIRQESGAGAFHTDGWNYNPFYREIDGPWAQPTNDDGIMQVTPDSGYHEMSGPYTHTPEGYDHVITDGCGYFQERYNVNGSLVQSTLQYNTGPDSLHLYLGLNAADRDYLSNIATQMTSFVPATYNFQNPILANMLDEGQIIVNNYLYNKGLASGQSLEYYESYQNQMDNELHNIGELDISYDLKAGWNMVSIPLTLIDNSISAVFPDSIAVYKWDPVNKVYIIPSTIEPATGYWVAMLSDTTFTITGFPITNLTTNISAGWNMIGSVINNVSIADPNDYPDNCVQPYAYWWDPVSGFYTIGVEIEPTKGYWAASVCDCILNLP